MAWEDREDLSLCHATGLSQQVLMETSSETKSWKHTVYQAEIVISFTVMYNDMIWYDMYLTMICTFQISSASQLSIMLNYVQGLTVMYSDFQWFKAGMAGMKPCKWILDTWVSLALDKQWGITWSSEPWSFSHNKLQFWAFGYFWGIPHFGWKWQTEKKSPRAGMLDLHHGCHLSYHLHRAVLYNLADHSSVLQQFFPVRLWSEQASALKQDST